MSGMSSLGRRAGMVRLACYAVAAMAMAAVCRPALAVVPSPTGFRVDVSSSPRVLDALDMMNDEEISAEDYHDIIWDEMCDNPHLRIRARNKPAIMIVNYPAVANAMPPQLTSAAPITSFTLTINEGDYAFGMGDVLGDNFTNFIKNTIYTDPGVTITGSSLSNSNKTLTVTFDGLTAGKKAIFNVDLDPTNNSDFVYPDYRMVLFGAPLEGEDPTLPATVTATFTGPLPAPNTITQTRTFKQFEETPTFFNENIRAYRDMDGIDVNGIPEPAGVSLALAGIAALAARFRKGRRIA